MSRDQDAHFTRFGTDARREGRISRRAFLGAGAAGGAALLTGGFTTLSSQSAVAKSLSEDLWLEQSIPELQAMMGSGSLTSRELTQAYLQRIRDLNPLLHAVIETNPQAVSIAANLDNERRAGHVRGSLHGIPILVKDNIATKDHMETTAGSLALVGSRVPGDAPLVARLRAAGAVILGKANLSEWANWRGFPAWDFNGWSARGGKTRDPYLLSFDPCGSSSGSAVAAAANLCAAAIGTETDGSIVCPASNNLLFGLKPTLGLISQDGIIPIAHSQDTAGPMARTVTDVAILLGVMRSPFGPVLGHQVPHDYTQFLDANSLEGATIGIDQRYLTGAYAFPVNPNSLEAFNAGLDALESLGATLVPCDTGDIFAYGGDEFTVLLQEFKVDIEKYLAGLGHTSMRTLSDLIAFNSAHCEAEMPYYGQELFEISERHDRRAYGSDLPRRARQLPGAVPSAGDRCGPRIRSRRHRRSELHAGDPARRGGWLSERRDSVRLHRQRSAGRVVDVRRGSWMSRSCLPMRTRWSRHCSRGRSRPMRDRCSRFPGFQASVERSRRRRKRLITENSKEFIWPQEDRSHASSISVTQSSRPVAIGAPISRTVVDASRRGWHAGFVWQFQWCGS